MKISAVFLLLSTLVLASNGKISNRYAPKYTKHSSQEKSVLQTVDAPQKSDGNILNHPETDEVEDVNKYITSSKSERKEHKSKSRRRDNKHGHHGHEEGRDSNHGDHHRHNVDRPNLKDNHHSNGHRNDIESVQHKNTEKIVKDKKEGSLRQVAWTKSSPEKRSENALDPCKILKCKRRHLCVLDSETGKAECVSKKLLRQRQKQMKSSKANRKEKGLPKQAQKDVKATKGRRNTKRDKKHIGKSKKHNPFSSPKRFHRFVTKMKNKAEHFKNSYSEKKRHELHQIRQLAHTNLGATEDHGHHEKAENYEVNPHEVSSPPVPTKPYCSLKDLSEMSKRLLDWFKVLQDEENHERDHVIQKRNSMKKELHEQDECICQAPVRYEFLNLDKDDDGVLSDGELENIESNGYEHCIRPFVKSCDHNADGQLSNKEWCCCFADVMPPCLTEMNRIPATVSSGSPAIMPGARVPQCDSDGFYKPLQCHSSTGYCWCVDRNGVELQGTNTRGTLNCEDLDSEDNTLISQEAAKGV